VGAEAKDVIDPDREQRVAVGMVIRSDRFPDKLFAPPKRTELMEDHVNPVYDKEMRSELFGQGTLMLRLVIQLSMFLALPLMATCLYIQAQWAPWYAGYVLVFNMLVGPVFSAGSVTGERERQTLDLLLCTTVSPWQILRGKLLSGLRISSVLTSFLVWPLLLAWLLPPWTYRSDAAALLGYAAIIMLTSLTTTMLALFCSVIFRKTSVSMMTSYLVVMVLFALPLAVSLLARLLFRDAPATLWIGQLTFTSPFAAAFSLPLSLGRFGENVPILANWPVVGGFFTFYVLLNASLLCSMLWLFNVRWRVSA
jgi:ABC-type transport system involved in multi-copper enzyme maturation permease subunit